MEMHKAAPTTVAVAVRLTTSFQTKLLAVATALSGTF